MNVRSLAAVAALISLFAAGCGRSTSEESQNGPSQASPTTSNPQAVPENSSSMNPTTKVSRDIPSQQTPAAAPHTWQVALSEYHIQFPSPIPAGPQALDIVNSGKEAHGLVIVVNGVDQVLTTDLPRGNTVNVTVDLKPGTYTVYCPVDGHKHKGMTTTVVVK